MFLTEQDVAELSAWRRKLHRMPEISGEETQTAREVRAALADTNPDRVISGLGGHGVAAVFAGAEPGPTVMFRAELDALPIEELSEVEHRSAVPGKGHLCGHDGHMATLVALARGLGRQRPARGRAVLLFQPAEETGAGAAAVIRDPRFREIAPDLAFSYHNRPGLPRGAVALVEGPVNCASRGMRVVLSGKTAHASEPDAGLSPMAAVARLMPALTALGGGGVGGGGVGDADFAMVTVTHATMGSPCFGVAPGQAEIWATLRSLTDTRMERLRADAERLVRTAADDAGLGCGVTYEDVFDHCENAPEAVAHLRRAIAAEGLACDGQMLPMRGSEDFGRFGQQAPAAMFFLGAGERHPRLHNPDYDFPDALIGIGAGVFMQTLRGILG